MRVVRAAPDLAAALESARREAKAAFGDDHMLIEKYVDNPRHIEVQVIGDSHGNLVSLFERECTLQRRHQKVVEEAPSPTLDAAQREAICAAARKAAGAVSYLGAGTVEFVSDGKDVFFIEMNTRLQVEHPVTELISGVDLVEWQLRVAFGETLPLRQDEIRLNGHAVEVRVYAENPHKNFMPSVGRISTWRMPPERDGLRIDAGTRAGSAVTPYYDAMLAKVIAYGGTREVALARLTRALGEADVRGVVTNIPFLTALVSHEAVHANAVDTGFIERELAKLTPPPPAVSELELAAAVAAVLAAEQAAVRDQGSPWLTGGWMPVGRRSRAFTFRHGSAEHGAVLHYGPGGATLDVGGHEVALAFAPRDEGLIEVTVAGVSRTVMAVVAGRQVYVRTRNGRFELTLADPFGVAEDEAGGHDRVVAPLPGTVVALLAQEGAAVEKGDPILTLEVMKMEQTLRAPYAGTVRQLKCKIGDIVQEGAELAEIEPAETDGRP
jgi:3-methylcrotonyl-CoA carboxylase alpha subunit